MKKDLSIAIMYVCGKPDFCEELLFRGRYNNKVIKFQKLLLLMSTRTQTHTVNNISINLFLH